MEDTARNLVEIPGRLAPEQVSPRRISDADWRRFEGCMGEIFTMFGMGPDTPGTGTQMRGVREEHSKTVPSVWRRGYTDNPDLRREFLAQLRSRNPWS